VNLLLKRMAQESSGNPTAVNNWDINAKRGDPSKGLMQNIGSAFSDRARELTNRGIFDGFANIVASIRYTLGRYGSLQRGWSRPGGY
jgi:SLT domain-containing protein